MFASQTLFSLRRCAPCRRSLLRSKESAAEVLSGTSSLDNSNSLRNERGGNEFHTSCAHSGSRNLLKKFVSKTKKKPWYNSHNFGPKNMIPPGQFEASKPATVKKWNQGESGRMRILNSLLFKAIRDLLDSPEVNCEVYNLSVEISKVALAGDFSSCRVYWRTSGAHEKDAEIQQVLDRSSPRIRYLLISRQIMGGVPPVIFIKDKEYAAISEVEKLLKVADFGEELMEESSEKSDQIEKDGGKPNLAAHSVGKADAMKQQNLFGIDHEALMRQILEYKQKPRGHQSDASTVAFMQQQQLELLEELRRQKMIQKKKKKSKYLMENDITPKDYLLAKYFQEQDSDEQDDAEYNKISDVKEPEEIKRKS